MVFSDQRERSTSRLSQASATEGSAVTVRGIAGRLWSGWQPSAFLLEFASGIGIDCQATAGAFVDNWLAESGARAHKLDWDAAFRSWCRRDADHPTRGPGARRAEPQTAMGMLRDTAAEKAAKGDKMWDLR